MSTKRSPDSPTEDEPLLDNPGPAVRFDRVTLAYAGSPPVLRDVSFSLAPGSIHFLTGASGSGKTSILKLIYMAQRPTQGGIQLLGHDLASLPRSERPALRQRIGVIFQDFRLLDHLSAFDNAALAPRIAGRKAEDYGADVAELLAWVGLGERMDALPGALSDGEKQRLAIARAVVNRPEIVLADEPTGNVDAAIAQRILRLLSELNRIGATILIASHDEDLVARTGIPVLHLSDGVVTRFERGRPTSAP
jgi:cell division transport system ATP-binding protein